VNWRLATEPLAVVTVTYTAPVVEALGVTAVMLHALVTMKLWAGMSPNFTAVTPKNSSPEIVTDVPPLAGPEFEATPLIVGQPTMLNNTVTLEALSVVDPDQTSLTVEVT
jgi:hypothetical protein